MSKKLKILLISSDDSRGGIAVFVSQLNKSIEDEHHVSRLHFPAQKTFSNVLNSIVSVFLFWFTRFDVVLISHINYVPVLSFLFWKRSVLFVHGIELELSKKELLNRPNIVFANSKKTKLYLESVGISRVEQSYYPSQFSDTPNKLGIKDFEKVSTMFVARLREGERYKGISSVISAFENLSGPDSRFELQIYGDHQYNIHKSSHNHNIQVFGYVDSERLKEAYQHSNLFVMPSSQEGQGLVYLEALQFGVPVIALEDSPASEFITNGYNGQLIANDSPDLIISAIRKIVDSPSTHSEYCMNAYDSFQKMNVQNVFHQNLSRILSQCAEY